MMDEPFPWGPAQAVPFFRGLRARIVATVLLLVGGLCWLVLYLAFLATHYPWYQNFTIVLVSCVAVPTAVVVMWVLWGMSMGRHFRHAFWHDEFP